MRLDLRRPLALMTAIKQKMTKPATTAPKMPCPRC